MEKMKREKWSERRMMRIPGHCHKSLLGLQKILRAKACLPRRETSLTALVEYAITEGVRVLEEEWK